jgi:AbrB family looped-hinge helix DNA binding protein
MVKTAKVTSKNQITIPKPVREKLGIQIGDELLFEYREGELVVTKQLSDNPFEKYRGRLKHLKGEEPDEIVSCARDRQ